VVCIIRTQRHSASAVVGEECQIEGNASFGEFALN